MTRKKLSLAWDEHRNILLLFHVGIILSVFLINGIHVIVLGWSIRNNSWFCCRGWKTSELGYGIYLCLSIYLYTHVHTRTLIEGYVLNATKNTVVVCSLYLLSSHEEEHMKLYDECIGKVMCQIEVRLFSSF